MYKKNLTEPNKPILSPVVLIPALSPDRRLIELTRQILESGLEYVIVVDDGSNEASAPVFSELESIPACIILRHDENKGKGRALKTGMLFFLENFPESVGVITADGDGQHTAADIKIVADELCAYPGDLVLGVRDFSRQDVPTRSRFGNTLTRWLFKLLTGLNLTDTQTGLRGIPSPLMNMFCALKGERYDFELNVLMACKQQQIAIRQTKIATIYLDNNSGTHFNPLTDSIRVYLVFIKFISSSLVSFCVDYSSFLICLAIMTPLITSAGAVFWAGIISRVLSSTVNYIVNRKVVFKSDAKSSTLRYYILCAALMIISSGSVTGLHVIFGGGAPFFKLLVDFLLFFGSFTIQREWVFRD